MCKENGNKIRQLQIKETRFILPYLIEFIKSSNFYLLLCYSFRFVVHAYEALAKTQYFLPCCVHFHCNSVHIYVIYVNVYPKMRRLVYLFKYILSLINIQIRAGTIQGSFDSVRFRFKTVRFGFFRIGSVHVEENLLCKG